MTRIVGLEDLPAQDDQASWPAARERMARLMKTRTRAEWSDLLEGSDACFAPVLNPDEAMRHPHNRQRATFTEVAGVSQPAPAPRFSRTPAEIAGPPAAAGQHTDEALADWGFGADEVARLRGAGVVR
jgi:alpha-methylacyl-CoA racemase